MKNSKKASTLLANNFKLSKSLCPTTRKEMEEMTVTHYLSIVGNLMYDMVCTRPYNAHVVGIVSKFLSNLGKKHWEVVK